MGWVVVLLRCRPNESRRRVVMISASPVMLTSDGMEQLANELAGFRERRATLAGALATSPDDVGEIQGELFLADRRIAEIQGVLARAQPIDAVARIPGVV